MVHRTTRYFVQVVCGSRTLRYEHVMATKTRKEKTTTSSPYASASNLKSKAATSSKRSKMGEKTKTQNPAQVSDVKQVKPKAVPSAKPSPSSKTLPNAAEPNTKAKTPSLVPNANPKYSQTQNAIPKTLSQALKANPQNSVQAQNDKQTKKPAKGNLPVNSSHLSPNAKSQEFKTKPTKVETVQPNLNLPPNESQSVRLKNEAITQNEKPLDGPLPIETQLDDYEDDFDSYESDFESESDTSTPSLDSRSLGNVSEWNPSSDEGESDIQAGTPGNVPQEIPDADYAAWKRDLTIERQQLRTSKLQPSQPTPQILETNNETKPFALDFASAKKRQQQKQTKSRADTLLSMIQLDIVCFQLVQWSPAPYDVFMQAFGRRDTRQVAIQTGDGAQARETQTVSPSSATKWTQFPPTFNPRNFTDGDWHCLAQERLGVGDPEVDEIATSISWSSYVPSVRLQKFLETAGEVMLSLIAEKAVTSYPSAIPDGNQGSKMLANVGHVTVDGQTAFLLDKRTVTHISYAPQHAHWLVTVLSPCSDETKVGILYERWLLCLWNTKQLAVPQKIFSACGSVTCLAWGPSDQIILAGLADGTLCCWNLNEPSSLHPTVLENGDVYVLRTPTYMARADQFPSILVGVACLSDPSQKSTAFQVYALEDRGRLTAWAGLSVTDSAFRGEADIGLSPWGNMVLIAIDEKEHSQKMKTLQLPESMFFCMHTTPSETATLLLGGESGLVWEWGLAADKLRTRYLPPPGGELGSVTSIRTCMEFPNHFLAGNNVGLMAFYRRPCPTPISYWRLDAPVLKSIEWMPWKPELFLAWVDPHKVLLFKIGSNTSRPMEELPMDFSVTAVGVSGQTPPQLCLGGEGKFEIHIAAATGDEARALANLKLTLEETA